MARLLRLHVRQKRFGHPDNAPQVDRQEPLEIGQIGIGEGTAAKRYARVVDQDKGCVAERWYRVGGKLRNGGCIGHVEPGGGDGGSGQPGGFG